MLEMSVATVCDDHNNSLFGCQCHNFGIEFLQTQISSTGYVAEEGRSGGEDKTADLQRTFL